MTKTTIELEDSTKEKLKDARLDHETNYDDTVSRLLGESNGTYLTEQEVREVVRDELEKARR